MLVLEIKRGRERVRGKPINLMFKRLERVIQLPFPHTCEKSQRDGRGRNKRKKKKKPQA
jgi:hypothetical protein